MITLTWGIILVLVNFVIISHKFNPFSLIGMLCGVAMTMSVITG